MTTLTQNMPDGGLWGGRVRTFKKVIALAAQPIGTVTIGRIPPGHTFMRGWLATDTSLATATVAIGIAGSTAKYKAAGTLTATNTPTVFGNVAAMLVETDSEVGSAPFGQGTNEDVIMTVAVAALPATGNLVVELEFSAP